MPSPPPDTTRSYCLKDPKCVGFRIANDQTAGDILLAILNCPGWFTLPAGDGTPGTQ
jgi:hypothetical protein